MRWWRSPLQDFLQVKVGAKALDIGEDTRPCEFQELPALGVDELLDFGQSFSQLAEEVDDQTIIFWNGGRVSPSMPRRCAFSMSRAENPRNICMRCRRSTCASALESLAS
jgi:hypothetical protein